MKTSEAALIQVKVWETAPGDSNISGLSLGDLVSNYYNALDDFAATIRNMVNTSPRLIGVVFTQNSAFWEMFDQRSLFLARHAVACSPLVFLEISQTAERLFDLSDTLYDDLNMLAFDEHCGDPEYQGNWQDETDKITLGGVLMCDLAAMLGQVWAGCEDLQCCAKWLKAKREKVFLDCIDQSDREVEQAQRELEAERRHAKGLENSYRRDRNANNFKRRKR